MTTDEIQKCIENRIEEKNDLLYILFCQSIGE